MPTRSRHVSNPLTLIAIFAGLAEVAGTAVLPVVPAAIQTILVWYVIGFPILLVLLFFLTLNFNNRVLYAPSDYQDEGLFVATLRGGYVPEGALADAAQDDPEQLLRDFWRPGGRPDETNERRLKEWMQGQGIDPDSIAFFLMNSAFRSTREKAVRDLGLV